ncbi:MAG: lysine--tRNA ligase [Acidobacteria bacterium]|nr:lysine--tRNA ligase [Acidobacteriota bacterium]
MTIPAFDEIIEPNDQTAARAEHLEKLRELTGNVYPNKFVRSRLTGGEDTITALRRFPQIAEIEHEMAMVKENLAEGERPPADIKELFNEKLKKLGTVRIAGRLTTPPRGNFVHLTDGIGKLQIYAKKGQFVFVKNDADGTVDAENAWAAWGMIDHGDFIGVEGYLFVTNTGEVSVHVEKLQFLAKAMLPMPDKMHGIADPEIRQRQRYADLIASSLQVKSEPPASAGGQELGAGSNVDAAGPELTTREVFERRAKIISSMRRFLEDHGYIEVETPMLTPKATGAAARPFETHHNALDIPLYARIAPELYLKRLVVGGFEKVYELNRNFRNEGISYKHNPEFTMLEFYCAYMDVNGMMDFCEDLLRESVRRATGGLTVEYEGNLIDFGKFRRISMLDAVGGNLSGSEGAPLSTDATGTLPTGRVSAMVEGGNLSGSEGAPLSTDATGTLPTGRVSALSDTAMTEGGNLSGSEGAPLSTDATGTLPTGRVSALSDTALVEAFEETVEPNLIQPTFIIDFPKSISPLSKASPDNPQIAERFELFINGMEVANGFSELNDPREQYERFVDQMAERERGDDEAMVLDEDYIRALSYGMPPAAGIGIGIDRLVMLLTNRHSIRDVILFPHMRPEKRSGEDETAEPV